MLANWIETLINALEQLVLTTGISGIALIAFLENVFPPTPSEFLYPLAGKLAYEGQLHLISVMLAGAAGSLIGAWVFYHVGYYLGVDRVRRIIERYGTITLWHWQIPIFTVTEYDRAIQTFDQHGAIMVMLARPMPLIHGVISIPAGISRMNRVKFLLYSFIGVLLWIIPSVLLGYFLGSQWDRVLNLLDTYETLCYIIFALLILYYLVSRWQNRTRQDVPQTRGNSTR